MIGPAVQLLGIHKLAKLVQRKDCSQKRVAATGDDVSSHEDDKVKLGTSHN